MGPLMLHKTQTKQILAFKDTKTEDSVRTLKIPTSALAMLNEHRNRQDEFRRKFGPDYRADLDLVFANPDFTPLKPDSVSASVSALCRRLKLPKGVSLHSLRHTHGSHMLASGVPLPVVSERLGHSSIRGHRGGVNHGLAVGLASLEQAFQSCLTTFNPNPYAHATLAQSEAREIFLRTRILPSRRAPSGIPR